MPGTCCFTSVFLHITQSAYLGPIYRFLVLEQRLEQLLTVEEKTFNWARCIEVLLQQTLTLNTHSNRVQYNIDLLSFSYIFKICSSWLVVWDYFYWSIINSQCYYAFTHLMAPLYKETSCWRHKNMITSKASFGAFTVLGQDKIRLILRR